MEEQKKPNLIQPVPPKTIQLKYRLIDIDEMQFHSFVNEWSKEEMQVGSKLDFNPDVMKRTVRCVVESEYKLNDITQLIIQVQNTFEFTADSWSALYQLQGDQWLLPAGLLQQMADATINSARGILAVRTKDLGFPAVLLPPVDVRKVVNKNLIVPRRKG